MIFETPGENTASISFRSSGNKYPPSSEDPILISSYSVLSGRSSEISFLSSNKSVLRLKIFLLKFLIINVKDFSFN